MTCSNCHATMEHHCRVHAVPCCPGRCPGPGPAFTPNEVNALLAVEMAARTYANHSHGNLGKPDAYRAREEARETLRDALAHLDYVRRPMVVGVD